MSEYKGKAKVKSQISGEKLKKIRSEHPYGLNPPTQKWVIREPKSKGPAKLSDKAQSKPLGAPKGISPPYKADTPKSGRDASGHIHGKQKK